MLHLTLLLFLAGSAPALAVQGTCPPTFESFLARFQADAGFQRTRTARRLVVSRLVPAEPEPQTITKRMIAAQIRYPVMPDAAALRRQGLALNIHHSGGSEAVVIVRKPDTDYQIRYTFRRAGCWELVRKDDESL